MIFFQTSDDQTYCLMIRKKTFREHSSCSIDLSITQLLLDKDSVWFRIAVDYWYIDTMKKSNLQAAQAIWWKLPTVREEKMYFKITGMEILT